MHAHAEVVIEDLDDPKDFEEVKAAVYGVIASFCEHDEDNHDTFYDWHQVGGRWTGAHDKFDPYSDPRNYEDCKLCNNTGFRTDAIGVSARQENPSYTCNACGHRNDDGTWTHSKQGPGRKPKWPTDFAFHEGDVIRVEDCPDDLQCCTLVADGDFFEMDEDGHSPKTETVKKKLASLGITTGWLVTVDYHY